MNRLFQLRIDLKKKEDQMKNRRSNEKKKTIRKRAVNNLKG